MRQRRAVSCTALKRCDSVYRVVIFGVPRCRRGACGGNMTTPLRINTTRRGGGGERGEGARRRGGVNRGRHAIRAARQRRRVGRSTSSGSRGRPAPLLCLPWYFCLLCCWNFELMKARDTLVDSARAKGVLSNGRYARRKSRKFRCT